MPARGRTLQTFKVAEKEIEARRPERHAVIQKLRGPRKRGKTDRSEPIENESSNGKSARRRSLGIRHEADKRGAAQIGRSAEARGQNEE